MFITREVANYFDFARFHPGHYFNLKENGGEIFRDRHGREFAFFHNPGDVFWLSLVDILAIIHHIASRTQEVAQGYGAKWAQSASYIEVSAAIGLHALIRWLCTLPHARLGTPMVIVLAGTWQPTCPSLYTTNWCDGQDGLNDALFPPDPTAGFFAHREDLVRAFIGIAHALGFKVLCKFISNSGQVQVNNEWINWTDEHHRNVFVGKWRYAAWLGFDGAYSDSIKHCGGLCHEHLAWKDDYGGVGLPAPWGLMKSAIDAAREVSPHFVVMGEYAPAHPHSFDLGLDGSLEHKAQLIGPERLREIARERQENHPHFGPGIFCTSDNTHYLRSEDRLYVTGLMLGSFGYELTPRWWTADDFMPTREGHRENLLWSIDWRRRVTGFVDWESHYHRWRMGELFCEHA